MKTDQVHSQTRQRQPTAVATATLPVAEIGPWLSKTYGAIACVIAESGAVPAGPPFARYHRLAEDRFAVEAGFPVSTAIDADGDVQPSELPGGPVAVTVHIGPYAEMARAYEALASRVSSHRGEPAGDPWEVYFSDPAREPDPATWPPRSCSPTAWREYQPPGSTGIAPLNPAHRRSIRRTDVRTWPGPTGSVSAPGKSTGSSRA